MTGACGCLVPRPSTPCHHRSPARGADKALSNIRFASSRCAPGLRVGSSFGAPSKRWIVPRVPCFIPEEKKEVASADGSLELVDLQNTGDLRPNRLTDFICSGNGFIKPTENEHRPTKDTLIQAVGRFFSIDAEPWVIPWTAETILQVMLLWIFSFWLVGSWIMPFLAHAAGFSKETLTHRGQALYSLLTDLAEGLAGIIILRRCLARFRPLPPGWFVFRLKGRWHLDVCLGCLLFPLVNFLSQVNLNLVPVLPTVPVGVSSVEHSVLARVPVAISLYVVVVSVCAPIWEEIMFRGFLIPSPTRYMPLWGSIAVSAVAFALAHFNAQRLLPLVFLGGVMGAVFARSRNLLACILLHSLWNGFVFLGLLRYAELPVLPNLTTVCGLEGDANFWFAKRILNQIRVEPTRETRFNSQLLWC